jgi:hypothetical protein
LHKKLYKIVFLKELNIVPCDLYDNIYFEKNQGVFVIFYILYIFFDGLGEVLVIFDSCDYRHFIGDGMERGSRSDGRSSPSNSPFRA